VGRGSSDWLSAKADYGYPQYCADMAALIARVTGSGTGHRIYWVGTSMGGILGMVLAASAQTPIEKLVVNDVGALIPKEALERIGAYVGRDPRFDDLRALEAYLRLVCVSFGPLTDAQWRHLAEHGAKRHEDGRWGLSYDPDIAAAFRNGPIAAVDLWRYYDAIRCPTLLLRGAQSDLLRRDTALEMTRRGPRARLVEFEGVGHAPMLMAADQIAAVREFLLNDG
jgi:pimeloyl-ACP methyl ester carboxylesterase